MPRKRTRGSSSTSFNTHKFVSEDAQERYNSMLKRKVIKERGIEVDRTGIIVEIRRRRWEKFTEQPEAAVLPVVREFYANAMEHDNFAVMVRGKKVSFDRTSINSYYGLTDIDNGQYSQFLKQENKWDVIIGYLATPGTTWKTSGSNVISFPAKVLTREAKAWYYFIGAKMLPVTHFSDVFRDRAAVIYAIENRLSIDVGLMVQNEILRCAKTSSVGLFFPSMITGLCKAVGVKWEANEEWIPPLCLIDFNQHFTIKDRPGTGTRSGVSPATPLALPAPERPLSTKEKLNHLQMELAETRRDVQDCQQQLHYVQQWSIEFERRQQKWEHQQLRYQQYQANFNNATAATLELLTTSLGIQSSSRPPIPRWEAQTSSTEQDEENNSRTYNHEHRMQQDET